MKQQWILAVLVILILALLGGIYSLGYRIGPGLSILKTHTLTINGLAPGTQVFADLTSRGIAKQHSFSIELTPGSHSILANVDGYQPWEGLVTVPENTNASVYAFLIPKTVAPKELLGADALRAQKLIDAAELPTASTTLSLLGGCAEAFVLNNRLLAESTAGTSCAPAPYLEATEGTSTPTIIFSPVDTIRSVVLYPGRSDAFVITAGTQVYALGLDPRSPQAFSKLISGVAPVLTEELDGTLLIADAGHVYSLVLPSLK